MMLVNGQPGANLDVRDRGLAYGDGVFRTVRCEAGQPLWWNDHYAKLRSDCAALNLACPDASLLRAEVEQVASPQDGVVKIVLTRGAGARGYAPPRDATPTRIVMAAPLPDYAQADAAPDIQVRWCTLRLARQPRLAGIKHLNRLENVLARAEWDDPAVFEGLLCDDSGAVIGGTMSNLLVLHEHAMHTPDLSACGVAGVARERLLRAVARHGIAVHVAPLTSAAILAADAVFLCNSVFGLRRVARLDTVEWQANGWFDFLKNALYEEVD